MMIHFATRAGSMMALPPPLPLLLLLTAPALAAAEPPRLSVTVADDGSFTVGLGSGGKPWLASAPSTLGARSLVLGERRELSGTDELGAWEADAFMSTTAGDTRVEALIRRYPSRGAITFDITLPDGARNVRPTPFNVSLRETAGPPMLSFPAFAWANSSSLLPELGLMTIQGDQIGITPQTWGSEGQRPANVGRAGGPFVLYEDPRKAAVALCPLTHFSAAVSHLGTDDTWRWGPSAEITSLPAGFTHRTLLVLGPQGATDAWERMGATLKALHPKATTARVAAQAADLNVNVLSYYTDAGDEYGAGLAAEKLAHVITSAKLPFGLVQLDDWSHATNRSHPVNCGCLENWTADPQFFGDSGWPGFVNTTGLPLALYLPGAGLCPSAGEKHYGIQTLIGGDGGGADDATFFVPTPEDAARFFAALMAQGLANGMGHTFEIDFLWFQFLQVPEWRSTLADFPKYFAALGAQASAANVAVELCMSFPLHVISAIALPAITSTRVGADYDWPTNCNIGVSSLLPWAIGLRPSKDSFMSSNRSKVMMGPPFVEPGFGGNPGALPELNAIIAAFSTGPVGVADGLGATSRSVVLPTCNAAGELLQPDRPMLAVDASYTRPGQDVRGAPNGKCKSTWMSASDGGAVWASVTQLNASQTTHFVLAINVSRPWVLSRSDLWPRGVSGAVYVSRRWPPGGQQTCVSGTDAIASGCVVVSHPGGSLPDLRGHPVGGSSDASALHYGVGESPFVLLAIHEVLSNGWVVWEEGKYVSVSRRRFASIRESDAGLRVELRGAPSEVVELTALRPQQHHYQQWGDGVMANESVSGWTVVSERVTISQSGVAVVELQ